MKTTTAELLEELQNIKDIQSFFNAHEKDFLKINPVDYLNSLLNSKNVTVADIIKKSNSGEYLYKVFSGERKASRDVIISIAFGLSMSVDELQLLLRISKFAVLDSRDKRDSIIIYSLSHNLSSMETNNLLYENNAVTLF